MIDLNLPLATGVVAAREPGVTLQVVSLLAALGLALTHLLAGKLRFLDGTPRSVWLSVAGGVSVAYVFVHLLPEVSEVQEVLADALGTALGFLGKSRLSARASRPGRLLRFGACRKCLT